MTSPARIASPAPVTTLAPRLLRELQRTVDALPNCPSCWGKAAHQKRERVVACCWCGWTGSEQDAIWHNEGDGR